MMSPRTCRSVPAKAWGLVVRSSAPGWPAANQAHRSDSGQCGQSGLRAVQMTWPSSMLAAAQRAGASRG